MSKIFLVIQREYITRIRKRAFWVMALLGPLMFAIGMIVPLWVGMQQEEKKIIEVVDESGLIAPKLISTPDLYFINAKETSVDHLTSSNDFYALLYIPATILKDSSSVTLYSKIKVSSEIKFFVGKNVSEAVTAERLKRSGIGKDVVDKASFPVSVQNKKMDEKWKNEESTSAALVISLFSSVLIMFFIVLYGGQVMRGVMEEKLNRIVEVMISSVKPFELMMGKVIGIGLISLTQFLIWIMLTYGTSYIIQQRYEKALVAFSSEHIEQTLKSNPQLNVGQAMEISNIVNALESIDIIYLLSVFLVYFIFGYLLYSALFAGIGSVVDSETDTQQFVFPLIAPLMFVILFATKIISNPDGDLAVWLSLIPFTSPVAMMLRLPFEVPALQIFLSIIFLIGTFILSVWVSSRIYRTGILMYGKKVSFSELGKWILGKI